MTAIRPPEKDVRFESRIGYEWRTRSTLLRALTMVALVMLVVLMVYAIDKVSARGLRVSDIGWIAIALFHVFSGTIYPRIRASRQHLTIARQGIRQEIPLGTSWSLAWAEISAIRLVFARTFVANGWFYEIETIHGEKKRIHPAEWRIVEADDPLYPRPKLNEWLSKPWVGKEYIQHSALHAVLGMPPSEDRAAASSQPTVEDFLRTPRGKLVVAVAVAGCAYAYLDWGQYDNYRFLHGSFSTVLWLGVALFGIAGLLLMLGRSVTEKTMAVIFMLLPGFFAPAPLALRVNAATDWDGPVTRSYIATDSGFAAADGHGPYIEMSLYSRFRDGDKPRKEQNLAVYRGALGFDQLDLESITWSE